MNKEKPLVNSDYLLKKFPGKGGWTYAEIPEMLQNKQNPFGWVKVKGAIDGYELKQYKLYHLYFEISQKKNDGFCGLAKFKT